MPDDEVAHILLGYGAKTINNNVTAFSNQFSIPAEFRNTRVPTEEKPSYLRVDPRRHSLASLARTRQDGQVVLDAQHRRAQFSTQLASSQVPRLRSTVEEGGIGARRQHRRCFRGCACRLRARRRHHYCRARRCGSINACHTRGHRHCHRISQDRHRSRRRRVSRRRSRTHTPREREEDMRVWTRLIKPPFKFRQIVNERGRFRVHPTKAKQRLLLRLRYADASQHVQALRPRHA